MIICFGSYCAVRYNKFIVIFASAQQRRRKAPAEFYTLYGRYSENGGGKAIFNAVKHGLAETCFYTRYGTLYNSADRICVKPRLFNFSLHFISGSIIYYGKFFFRDIFVRYADGVEFFILNAAYCRNMSLNIYAL